eukprot:7875908-Heterocapsa_arctica.AAC.1
MLSMSISAPSMTWTCTVKTLMGPIESSPSLTVLVGPCGRASPPVDLSKCLRDVVDCAFLGHDPDDGGSSWHPFNGGAVRLRQV